MEFKKNITNSEKISKFKITNKTKNNSSLINLNNYNNLHIM